MKLNYLLKSLSFSVLFSILSTIIANAHEVSAECRKDSSKCNDCDKLKKYVTDNGDDYDTGFYCDFKNGEIYDLSLRWDKKAIPIIEKNTEIKSLLKNIKYLEFQEFDITQEYIDFITSLKSLEHLFLRENYFAENLKVDSFKELKNLERIDIVDFDKDILTEIPEFVYKIPNLKTLYIYQNNIKEIPDSITKLEKLEYLYYDDFSIIKKISEKICDLKNLKAVNIEIEEGTVIPKKCCHLFEQCRDTTLPISKTGKCGKTEGKCPSGQCCSKYGWCGTSEKYCSISQGCQSEFGQCNTTTSTTKTTTTKTTKKTTTTTKQSTSTVGVSKDGKCGKGKGRCPSGQCCSKYGWCGTSEKYCLTSKGCQSEFGKCN